MATILAFLAYAAALVVAAYLLFQFRRLGWYWHLLSILAALGIGLMPPPAGLHSQVLDIATGCAVVFLLAWGAGGFLVSRRRIESRA